MSGPQGFFGELWDVYDSDFRSVMLKGFFRLDSQSLEARPPWNSLRSMHPSLLLSDAEMHSWITSWGAPERILSEVKHLGGLPGSGCSVEDLSPNVEVFCLGGYHLSGTQKMA